ncbi:high mobility group protein HMG-I/HMG-Y-like isoform X1 [Lagopus leucura]|uniref:high mobility group protein HMG-I/HMG-Y-like isoform X1 n=1 Tax=Lagopus leucura TaxID=30410 RepID=UPI001C67C1F3|nr:high mobility group protein HMG-I/HMG-Y-like isoform X1 [Lagopus leucura]
MSSESLENPGPSPLTEGLKRKRGRPKKQPQDDAVGSLPEKKPRGRPKGSKKMSTVTGQMVEPPAGKRPRGRPRKWPQLVTQGASQEGGPQGSGDMDANSASAMQGTGFESPCCGRAQRSCVPPGPADWSCTALSGERHLSQLRVCSIKKNSQNKQWPPPCLSVRPFWGE